VEDITSAARVPLVSAEQLRRRLHMLEADADALLVDLSLDAQAVVETATANILSARQFRFDLPGGYWSLWWFPVRPVRAVVSVHVVGIDGQLALLEPAHYCLRRAGSEPVLEVFDTADTARAGLDLQLVADVGFASADDVPAGFCEPIGRLVKEWRDGYAVSAEEGGSLQPARLAMGARMLIKQKRYVPPRDVWPQ
jgi:uncharacterized phiE125 gp8 family phage protein